MEAIKSWKCHGGVVTRYRHTSPALGGLSASFIVFMPPWPTTAPATKVPGLFFLSGLTCTDENFITKAGAIPHAAEHGLALVCPDTSPRGANLGAEETASWDLGVGAGFYVDATAEPWRAHYRMASYIAELRALVTDALPIDGGRMSIAGHSMGGLGALATALRDPPGAWRAVTAFAPICHPSACAWGRKAFGAYLGVESPSAWAANDPTALVSARPAGAPPLHIRIDQGAADEFLAAGQLLPADFVAAAADAGVPVEYHLHDGYDHSYYFITTFIAAHIAHHAQHLRA